MEVPKNKRDRRTVNKLARQAAQIKDLEAKLGEAQGEPEAKGSSKEPTSGDQQEAELNKQLKEAKEVLAEFQNLSPGARGSVPEFEATVGAKQKEVDDLVAQLKGCKPIHTRVRRAQSEQEACTKKLAATTRRGEELQEQMERLEKERQELQQRATKQQADLEAANREFERLVAEQAKVCGASSVAEEQAGRRTKETVRKQWEEHTKKHEVPEGVQEYFGAFLEATAWPELRGSRQDPIEADAQSAATDEMDWIPDLAEEISGGVSGFIEGKANGETTGADKKAQIYNAIHEMLGKSKVLNDPKGRRKRQKTAM